jgi:DNA polymerase/3'-5' exonuclease PolX
LPNIEKEKAMKTKMSLKLAELMANDIVEILRPYCTRIEIAGSIRRKKPEVGDIEIVAKPKLIPSYDMFGTETEKISMLDDFDYSNIGKVSKGGSKYKQIILKDSEVSLDLFIVTFPAQWGVQFMIRTGSAEFSHKMVTAKQQGGYLPSNYKVRDGAVWDKEGIICMDDERDYFKLCGLEYVEPENRNI